MKGSIQKKVGKDGKPVYYAVIPFGPTKRKWERIGAVKKREADRYLRKRIEELERNFGRDVRPATFEELACEWMQSLKLDKKPHTLSSYQTQVNCHLIPFFGKMPVSKIFPEDVERFKQEMAHKKVKKTVVEKKDGVKNKTRVEIERLLSSTSINYDLRILRQILEAAIRWGYLYTNPATGVTRLKQERKEFKALTKENVTELLKAAGYLPVHTPEEQKKKNPSFSFIPGLPKTLIMTAVCTALRRGELLAMKWRNLDFEKGTYTVKEAFHPKNGMSAPKTDASLRTILLPKPLLDELRKYRIRQTEFRLKSSGTWQDMGLIFTDTSGGPMDTGNLKARIFDPSLKLAKLSHIRFHDLRGTAATLALEAGANVKAVQNLLGHTTPNLTLSVYAKVTEASQEDLADKLTAHLGL